MISKVTGTSESKDRMKNGNNGVCKLVAGRLKQLGLYFIIRFEGSLRGETGVESCLLRVQRNLWSFFIGCISFGIV